ncbi:conserved protein, unknown function [Hepatocystis sp. ex Piliocolobus tephrosceles]|nr:conserved protein, unknown function [Hepatocystis sp. ex Piliocolobus tephrosceles]
MFNSLLNNKVKHAKQVFDEVKEHIKSTAKEAQKNINYPFCKAPCNIENIKNTIFINEEEIIINKNFYKNIFSNKKNDIRQNNNNSTNNKDKNLDSCLDNTITPISTKNSSQKQTNKQNDNIFTCNENNIVITGDYNFDFQVEIVNENEENKIIVNAYDKLKKVKIPCTYKWSKLYYNKLCNTIENSLTYNKNNSNNSNSDEIINNNFCQNNDNNIKHIITVNNNNNNIYENEYTLTSEDIGMVIFVECSYIPSEQVNVFSESSQFEINNNSAEDLKNNNNNNNNNNNCYNINNNTSMISSSSSDSSNSGYNTIYNNIYTKSNSSTQNRLNNVSNIKNRSSNNKYYGVAKAEIGPINLSEKTKIMLEDIIHNDTIKYPIYILKKGDNNNAKNISNNSNNNNNNNNNDFENIKRYNNDRNYDSHYNSYENDEKYVESFNNNSFYTYDHNNMNNNNVNHINNNNNYNISENLMVYNTEQNENDSIYILHIHKNEIKIINQNNKKKKILSYSYNTIYPYIQFINKNKKDFLLYTNKNEYFYCRCLYRKHLDLISILLKYMHANLIIINEYIFNNINDNFENTRVKNIFNNVDVNYILENINKELLVNQKLNQQYKNKLTKIQIEKNMLEEDMKNTIEAFQIQLDTVKKVKDGNELDKKSEQLMKEIEILQEKYRNVDLFFKNKYELLLGDIEKYKKIIQENKSKTNSNEEEKLRTKLQCVEKEKIELLNENKKINNLYIEEKKNKTELQNKLEALNLKLDKVNKSLQNEKLEEKNYYQQLKELEELKKNNTTLKKENIKISNELNILLTDKNRLTKMVDSLTKDIEKSKTGTCIRSLNNKMEIEHNEKLLKEVTSLRDENELLKKRIKKMANFNTSTAS